MRLNWQKDAERKEKQNSEEKIRLMMGWLPRTIVTIGFCAHNTERVFTEEDNGSDEDDKRERGKIFGQTFFDSGQLMTLIEHE